MLSSSDDEDDPVVREIDMYLAKGLAEKLLLFQYPVRPSTASYDFTPHLAARIKPIQQKVELELGIDTNSSTYCYPRGEQIAHAVDGDDDQKQHFPANVMDRQCLSSVKATEDSSKYAAAIYCNNAIHITPIKGIFQLHPAFTYFDKAEENQKKAAAALSTNDDEGQVDEGDAKPVQLRFGKGQNQKKKDEVSKPAEEKWIETHFYQPQDRRAVMERNLLLCHQDDFESPEFTVTSRDYLKILSPSEQQGAESPADLPHGVLSLLKLKGMNLTDQIKALLITAKVLQFTQLCALLGGGMDISAVLTGLTQYAMLVQGCWVVKSNILYPEGTKSHVSGLDAAKLWPSRDYVMFCFNRKRVLSRKEVASNTRLPTEELREVLEQIGKQRPAQGWEFMLNTDNEFLKGHPEDCLNQLSLWKQRYKELVESLHLSEEFSEADWNENNFPGLFPGATRKVGTSRRRMPSQNPGVGSENEKPKIKSRRRTKSQSSQDGFNTPVEIKDENISPLRNINSSNEPRLNAAYDSSVSNVGTSQKSQKNQPHKLLQKNSKSSPIKSPRRIMKEKLNPELKSNGEKNLDINFKPTVESNLNMMINDIKLETNLVDNTKSELSITQLSENIVVENNSEVMEVDVDIKPPVEDNHLTGRDDNQIHKEKSMINEISKHCNVEVDEQKIGKRKRKKRIAAIISDDESDTEMKMDINKIPDESVDIYVEDSNKPMNEIEVGVDVGNISGDEYICNNICNNDNSEEIFVPPMAAGGRTIRDEHERPPSDIFIKELRKFCRQAIQSGCLSLMELKEVLHMRQQEAGNILCTGVSDELLVKCLKDSGAFEIPIRWLEPNNIPMERKRLFLYRYLGDNTDKYRSVVIDLFCESQSLRRKDIFEAFTKALNEVPSTHIYTKIISEFCQNHHGQWYLNGAYNTIQKFSNS